MSETTQTQVSSNEATNGTSSESSQATQTNQAPSVDTTQTQASASQNQAQQNAQTDSKQTEIPSVESFDDIKLDGLNITQNEFDSIKSFAKEKGFNKDQVKSLLERESLILSQRQSQEKETLTKNISTWESECKNDPILSKNFEQNIKYAQDGLAAYSKIVGNNKLAEILNQTGYGSHPEVVKLFKVIGEQLENDKLVQSRSAQTKPRDMSELFYKQN